MASRTLYSTFLLLVDHEVAGSTASRSREFFDIATREYEYECQGACP